MSAAAVHEPTLSFVAERGLGKLTRAEREKDTKKSVTHLPCSDQKGTSNACYHSIILHNIPNQVDNNNRSEPAFYPQLNKTQKKKKGDEKQFEYSLLAKK